MTDRERLIELCKTACSPLNCEKYGEKPCFECVADYLLVNGATFVTDNNVGSKWIPVTERFPQYGANVIALGKRGGVYVAQYRGSQYWHKLNARYHMCEPTHWMPLPEPPMEVYNE